MLKNLSVIIRPVLVVSFLLLTGRNGHAQIITTIAGNGLGTGTYTGDGGPATAAGMNAPSGITMDRSGNVYVAEAYNSTVRKISTSGIITTIAGTNVAGYNGDGIPATAAQLKSPSDVTVDDSGRIYIADGNNYRVRKIGANDTISTIAGTGVAGFSGDGGAATAAQLGVAMAAVMDSKGNLYISHQSAHNVRKITPTGIISNVAGNGSPGYTGDGGPAVSGTLNFPHGIALDRKGNLYIADIQNNRIRKVDTFGIITTVAGTGVFGYSGDGGAATLANLRHPNGVAVDTNGNIYIADCSSHRIRRVDTFGIITTFAGTGINSFSGDGGPASAATLSNPVHIYIDSAGHLYVTDFGNDRVRKITMPSATLAVRIPEKNDIVAYPIPMGDELFIENTAPGSKVSIFDAGGRLIYSSTILVYPEKINTRAFASGIYQLQITGPAGNKTSKTIVK